MMQASTLRSRSSSQSLPLLNSRWGAGWVSVGAGGGMNCVLCKTLNLMM